jgi:hypothetical protein
MTDGTWDTWNCTPIMEINLTLPQVIFSYSSKEAHTRVIYKRIKWMRNSTTVADNRNIIALVIPPASVQPVLLWKVPGTCRGCSCGLETGRGSVDV